MSLLWSLLWISHPAAADELLVTERIAIGVNPDGSLCMSGGGLCMMYDPDGPDGPIPLGGDLLLPGRPFEAWGASWSQGDTSYTVRAQAPDALGPTTLDWEPWRQTPDFVSFRGQADLGGGLTIQIDYDLPRRGHVVYMTHTFRAQTPIRQLSATRTVDNDPDYFRDGSYASVNYAQGSVAIAASRYELGHTLAVGLDQGFAAVCQWCVTPAEVRDGGAGPITADRVVGVASEPVDLEEGQELVLRFVYALAEDPDVAHERALTAMTATDLDGDGFTEDDGDCDDRDATVYPGAPELADGKDNNCNGEIDDDPVHLDGDGDGFTPAQGDCDDTDPRIYPGAPPVPGVLDANCDGVADEQPFLDSEPPEGWGQLTDEIGVACDTTRAVSTLPILTLILLSLARRRRHP
ncbi:MAG: hypothetical protein EA397_14945 [Deltaproteobacteria bacterium]|nr:MAG: hypothetical protein EA397_14945 [Deltaproteobacteria bacterium]